MKRLLMLLLLFALLSGCGTAPEDTAPPPISQETAGTESAAEESAVPLPVTEAGIQALYASESQTILEITPWENDFLVESGSSGSPSFDWIFGSTGIRRRLFSSYEGIRSYEILYTGAIQFTTDGIQSYNGYQSWPYVGVAALGGQWDGGGHAVYDICADGVTAGQEAYFAPLDEPAAFGMQGRSEAVLDARVDIAGLEMVFGPVAGQGFDAAFCAPPWVEICCEGTLMTVTCRDTYLDCMALSQGEPEDLAYLQALGTLYPDAFPVGALPGVNRFISHGEISQEDGSVVVRLTLTEAAAQYTVELGSLGPHDARPWFRLVFRETE